MNTRISGQKRKLESPEPLERDCKRRKLNPPEQTVETVETVETTEVMTKQPNPLVNIFKAVFQEELPLAIADIIIEYKVSINKHEVNDELLQTFFNDNGFGKSMIHHIVLRNSIEMFVSICTICGKYDDKLPTNPHKCCRCLMNMHRNNPYFYG